MAEFHPSILVASSRAGAETCQQDTVVTVNGSPQSTTRLACMMPIFLAPAYPTTYQDLPCYQWPVPVSAPVLIRSKKTWCPTHGTLHTCTICQGPGIKRSSGENTREAEISTGKQSGFSIQAVAFFARTLCTLWYASPKWSSKSSDCIGTNCCSAGPLALSECHFAPCKENAGQWHLKTWQLKTWQLKTWSGPWFEFPLQISLK